MCAMTHPEEPQRLIEPPDLGTHTRDVPLRDDDGSTSVRASGDLPSMILQAVHDLARPAALATAAKVGADTVKVAVQKVGDLIETQMNNNTQIQMNQTNAERDIRVAEIQANGNQSNTE